MTVTARLEAASVTVDAGGIGTARLTVRNDGSQVDAYQLEVVGEPAGWAAVQPAELRLYPGDEQQAEVVFSPPRSPAVVAGVRPFGVRVAGRQPEGTTVPEGQVEVLPYADLSVELTPRTSHARWSARHELAVDNRGNAPADLDVTGEDMDEAVVVGTRPDRMVVAPGEAGFVRIRVRPSRRRWTGTPVTLPFRVVAARSATQAAAVDGVLLQEPVLPRWLGKAVAVAAVVAALLAVGWVALLRPVVRTAAQDAVAEPVAAAAATADRAAKDAAGARTSADAAGTAAGQARKTAGDAAAGTTAVRDKLIQKGVLDRGEVKLPPGTGGGPGNEVVVDGTNYRQRLESVATAGGAARPTLTATSRQRLLLTDVFFENPQGDTGTVVVGIGETVLFRKSLANFRDLDDHFITPLLLRGGETLTFAVSCQRPGAGQDRCRPALLLVGKQTVEPTG